MKNTLIHLSSSPYASLACKEGLDLALVMATFEQKVDLSVSDAALALLITNQNPSAEHGKHLHKLLDGLEFYDIENIFIENTDAIQVKNLWQGTQALNTEEWNQLPSRYQQVFRF